MIKLILQIKEEEIGVCIYDLTEKESPVESEEKKLKIFMEAIREAALNEAKRLQANGSGKSLVGNEAKEKLNLTPEDYPEILTNGTVYSNGNIPANAEVADPKDSAH